MRNRTTITTVIVFAVLVSTEAASAYYSPAKGRFLARDPIGEKGGTNLHSFVRNQPVSKFDPAGMTEFVGPPAPEGLFQIDFNRDTDESSYFEVFFRPGDDIKVKCLCDEIKYRQYYMEWYGFGFVVIFQGLTGDWKVDKTGSDGFYIHQEPWVRGGGRVDAHAWDWPGTKRNWIGVNQLDWYFQVFKTSAVCTKGRDKGKSYGTVEWGHYFMWMLSPPSVARVLLGKTKLGAVDDNTIGWRGYEVNLLSGGDGWNRSP